MKLYNENSRCPKCGDGYIKTRYQDSDAWAQGKSKHSDIMKRICGKCGYCWYEEPLDKESKEL